MMNPGWYAEGRVSKEYAAIFKVHPRHLVRYGPYKRKSFALKRMRWLRDDLPRWRDGNDFDLIHEGGPVFTPSSVRHFEVKP